MHPDKDHIIGLDRRKVALNYSESRSLPQVDKRIYPSNAVCENLYVASSAMTVTSGDSDFDARHGKVANKKKRTRLSTLSRSGALLCPHLAILFLLTAHGLPSVVRAQAQAQAQNGNITTIAQETGITGAPTVTFIATNISDTTPSPSANPTTRPTISPTASPSMSSNPSAQPTGQPTLSPSTSPGPTRLPSSPPTMQPSLSNPITKETKFRQEFLVGNGREFNTEDIFVFETLYQRYTEEYSPLPRSEVAAKIETSCKVDKQIFLLADGERMLGYRNSSNATKLRGRYLEDTSSTSTSQDTPITPTGRKLTVDYTMKYVSLYQNVTTYPKLFQNWTNSNLNVLLSQMQSLKLNVTWVDSAKRIIVSTQAPTASFAPSMDPTQSPSVSFVPTVEILDEPSDVPGSSVLPPETDDQEPNGSNNSMIYITVSLVLAFSILAIGLFFYYKKRRGNPANDFSSNGSKSGRVPGGSQLHSGMGWSSTGAVPNPSYGTSETKAYGSSYGRPSDLPSRLGDGASSPPGSLVSSQSLISKGNSMGGDSREESDAANELLDEFDQYKDQNLEKMRAEIEHLPECNGMMSQAVAKALIDQDDEAVISASYWGGGDDITAPEIEASALGFVFDWLKRNDKVSNREKREIMQEQLNKMVASVLHKVIGPEDATRTYHEIVVLLGLKLASELSVTTILISGMRKKATAADIRKTFGVFGDVEIAAIAPNERGFGILRFKSSSAVQRAMGKFRTAEIVVEDVAVHLFLIKSSSTTGTKENGSLNQII